MRRAPNPPVRTPSHHPELRVRPGAGRGLAGIWRLAAPALLLVALGLMAGCATVKPWQRGRLGHACMKTDGRLGDAFRPHVLSVREGSVGGEGSAGGGCGCN